MEYSKCNQEDSGAETSFFQFFQYIFTEKLLYLASLSHKKSNLALMVHP